MEKLTPKRKAFVSYFLGEARFNATEAARLAGYKHPNVYGPTLVNISIVRKEIEARLADQAMDADEILWRLAEQARGNVADFLIDGDYSKGVDAEELKRRGHLVQSITWDKGNNLTIKIHSQQRALELLGKGHGLWRDNTQHSGEVKVIIERIEAPTPETS